MQADRAQHVAGSILRSITPLTGALVAGLCVAVPLIAAGIAEIEFGRPSSTAGLIFPFALIWGALAAAVGAAIGRAVADRVRTSRWAGPVHWRTVSIGPSWVGRFGGGRAGKARAGRRDGSRGRRERDPRLAGGAGAQVVGELTRRRSARPH